MYQNDEQEPAATTGRGSETALRLTACRWGWFYRQGAGSAGNGATKRRIREDAASLFLRQDGNPLPFPSGPGRDSEAGSVRSMTADRTPVFRFLWEVPQVQQSVNYRVWETAQHKQYGKHPKFKHPADGWQSNTALLWETDQVTYLPYPE